MASEMIKGLNVGYVVMTEIYGDEVPRIGGGLCINSQGWIITTATLTPANLERVRVRSRYSTEFRPADVLHVKSCFGIAFLSIQDVEEDEVFNYLNIADNLSIEEGDGFFSWIHNNPIVFSFITGNASFPFEGAIFPSFDSSTTVDTTVEDDLFDLRQNEYSETRSFRTIGGVIESNPRRSEICSLHPELPVIEVHGFLCTKGYGSPVFDMGGKFVGLILFKYREMNYILPSNMIKSYLDFITGTRPSAARGYDVGLNAELEMARHSNDLRGMARRSREINELDAVYVISTEVPSMQHIIGGGLCIRPEGVIITTAMVTPANHTEVVVRSRNSNEFRRATVLNVNFSFDISVLVIDPREEDEIFGFIDIGQDFPPIEEGDPLFSWIHSINIAFSNITGKVSFPFESVVFPRPSSRKTIGNALAGEVVEIRENAFLQTPSFRTIGGIVEDMGEGRRKLSHLHPKLPLIEVHGFSVNQDIYLDQDCYGSPVFDKRGGFVGLIMLEHCEFTYVLPSRVFRSYISQNLTKWTSSRGGAGSSHHRKGKDNKSRKDRVPHFPGGHDGEYV